MLISTINTLLNTYEIQPYPCAKTWNEEQEVVEWTATSVVEAACRDSCQRNKSPNGCSTT